jgi:hypothetical protein
VTVDASDIAGAIQSEASALGLPMNANGSYNIATPGGAGAAATVNSSSSLVPLVSLNINAPSSVANTILVPTVDQNGQVTGYSAESIATSNPYSNGSVGYTFNNNNTLLSGAAGTAEYPTAPSGAAPIAEWNLEDPSGGMHAVVEYSDGSYGTVHSSSGGGYTVDMQNVSIAPDQSNEVSTTDQSGSISAAISGTGAVENISNGTVSLANDTSAVVAGTNNDVAAGSNTTLDLQGAANTFSGGPNGDITISDTGLLGSDGQLNSLLGDQVNMSSGTVNVASGAEATLTGSNNTVSVAIGSQLVVAGQSNDIAATGSTVQFQGNASGDQLSGDNNTAQYFNSAGEETEDQYFGASGQLTEQDNAAYGSAGQVTQTDVVDYNANGSTTEYLVNYTSSGDMQNEQVIDTSSSGQVTDGVFGTGAVVELDNGTVDFNDGAQGTLIGDGNTINAGNNVNVDLQGAADSFSGGANGTITVGGNGSAGQSDIVDMASGTVNVENDARSDITGNDLTVNAAGNDNVGASGGGNNINVDGGNTSLWISGTNGDFTNVDGAGATVSMDANTQLGVNGSGDYVNESAGDTLGASGGGNTINTVGGALTVISNTDGNFDQVNATGDALGGVTANGQPTGININEDSQANITGSSDGVNESTGDSVGVYGGSNTINSVSDSLVVVQDTGGGFDQINVSGDTTGGTTANGQPTGIHINPDSQANIDGSDDGVVESSGASVGVYGSGNDIDTTGGALTVIGNTNGGFDDVSANGDAFGGSTANGQGTGIYLNGNSQANVYGSGDGIGLATGDSVGGYGGGNTIDSGADDYLAISDTAGVPDLVDANNDLGGGLTANGQATGISVGTDSQLYLNGSWNDIYEGYGDVVAGSLSSFEDTAVGNTSDLTDFWGSGIGDSLDGSDGTVGYDGGDDWDPEYDPDDDGGGYGDGDGGFDDPIILNLQGGKVQSTPLAGSTSYFDMQGTGQQVQTAWMTGGEGMLVYDPSGNGTASSDTSLVAGFDALEILAQSTGDSGKTLDASDALWSQLKVLVQPTGDSNPQDGALETLSQLGITSINLAAVDERVSNNGNTLLADSSFTWASGVQGDIAGVDLKFDASAMQASSTPAAIAASAAATTTAGPGSTSTSTSTSISHLIQSMASFTDGHNGIDDASFAWARAANVALLLAAPHAVRQA